jgi:hypothetical protein
LADDLAGLKTSLQQAFDALMTDKAAHNSEQELKLFRIFIALVRAKATANGVTGL